MPLIDRGLRGIHQLKMQHTPHKLLVFRLVLTVLVLLAGAMSSHSGEIGLLGVRLGTQPDKTRIVLDLTGTPAYRLSFLNNPNRLIIELPTVAWQVPAGLLPAGGIVQGIHRGAAGIGGSRLELLLGASARIALADTLLATETAPARLFVDLVPSATASTDIIEVGQVAESVAAVATESTPPVAARQTPPPPEPPTVLSAEIAPETAQIEPAAPAPAAPRVLPQVKPKQAASPAVSMAAMVMPLPLPPPAKPEAPGGRKWIVVFDPGHGGKDPGAIGLAGTAEKNVTLEVARELKEKLEATGRYQVFLSRNGDEQVALRDRTEQARAVKADLFISLHADHIDQAELRGASVYTLSENASDTEAAALAARENKADLITGVDLSSQSTIVASILIDLAQRETKNLSARFASVLSEELSQRTLMLRNAHRFAGFVVLKAPDVPSVLVELGYLSNKEDEQALASAEHRARLCEAIVKAIERYFDWQRSVKQT